MLPTELLEEIRLLLVKISIQKKFSVTALARYSGHPEDQYTFSRVFLGTLALEEALGVRMASALGVSWPAVVEVAKQRWEHNRLYGEAIQRLADLGAVAERSGG